MQPPLTQAEVLKQIIVSIDGPSGSGKSTTAREVAKQLALRHLDTGAMYRAVTHLALRDHLDLDNEEEIGALARRVGIAFEDGGAAQRVLANGEDVSEAIRTPEVTAHVSQVSAYPEVRTAMVRQQRRLADSGGVVLEGRDIGTVVLPHADVKVYLDASLQVRAERRMREFRERGVNKATADVEADLAERDRKDSSRETSPLRVPVGAYRLDTSDLTIPQQVTAVVELARRRAGELHALTDPARTGSLRHRPFHFRAAQALIRVILRVVWGVRIIDKAPYQVTENCIYACNHRSYTDPPFVGSTIRRNVFILAKSTLFHNAAFGWLIRTFHAIPIRRSGFDRSAMDLGLSILGRGDSLLMFPEGRRVDGDELGEPKAGIGYLAVHSGCPVVPMYAEGTNRLVAGLLRRQRLTIVHGRPLRLCDPRADNLKTSNEFREYGQMVMRAIQALKDDLDTAGSR